ncbi:hypothetical protein SI65_07213 [Aspergillus cristatus]|uniref:Uncharacterized protein n=1 Tax=Aspergillus cristatus TaxID=573508 RepID=A0A1E3B9I1_ASPCR|nr:hypothetical protein SI65_07213 [Aspergillus cristatus]
MTIFGFIQNPLTFDKSSPAHRARELRLSSAHELHKLLDIQRTRWPMEYIPLPSSQFSTVALFTLLEDLDIPSSASAFADTAISLFSIAKRLQLAKGMSRLVQGTAPQKKLRLAPEIRSIFRAFDEVLWAKEDKEKFSSLYPNFAVTVHKETVGEMELDDFLEQWDSLALGEGDTPDGE